MILFVINIIWNNVLQRRDMVVLSCWKNVMEAPREDYTSKNLANVLDDDLTEDEDVVLE